MTAFLDKTASYIYERFSGNFDQLCIVLPGRRAALFLKKYLANYTNKTIWAPAIFSIEDFVEEHSGVRILDRLSLTFELYEVHKQIEKNSVQPFDEFMKWGQQLLTDFNEVDLYMADSGKLYEYLNEARAMAVWNPDLTPLTSKEKDYLKFYNSLTQYYNAFKERLIQKAMAFQGMAYRIMANNIAEISKDLQWKNIVFVGFNALSNSEEFIINYLKHEGIAETLWDSDVYYLEDKRQEAGKFLRQHFKKRRKDEFKWIGDDLRTSEKNIKLVGVPQNIGQAKVLGQILQEISENNDDLDDTAIVLADENLLIPVLHSIPENIKTFNITMGLSLRYTPLYDLIDTLFSTYENAEKFSQIRSTKQPLYYHKIVEKLRRNYYIKSLTDNEQYQNTATAATFSSTDTSSLSRAFYTASMLNSQGNGDKTKNLYSRIFVDTFFNAIDMLDLLSWLLAEIRDMLIKQKQTTTDNSGEQKNSAVDVELEYVYSFSVLLKRLNALSTDYEGINDLKTLASVFRQLAKQTTVPFYGEPLKGLQIMGMLETRTLDFKNLIILSVNEKILPATKHVNSYIPHEIRKEFSLPTYRDKDSIFAYHFYRLLQRSKKIFLVYNTESNNMLTGEQSRFIKQLKNELPEKNPKIHLRENILEIPYKKVEEHPIIIKKTKEIFDKLKEKANSGFSPSVLNSYIQCPLKFYFENIEGLREKDKVEDEIDAKTYGTVLHKVLQILYEPYINKVLLIEDLKGMQKHVEGILRECFSKEYSGSDINYGKNLLKVKIAQIMLNDFIKSEIDDIKKNGSEIIIKQLEKRITSEININDADESGEKMIIKLKGFIDRIDIHNNTIRITDYKTGKVESSKLKIKEFENLLSDSKYGQSFQLLMYSYLYFKNEKASDKELNAGIFALKNPKSGLMKVSFPKETTIDKEIETKFGNLLKKLLEEIFNKDTSFRQTDDPDKCMFCPFVDICNRWNPGRAI